MKDAAIRSFVAIELPQELKERLKIYQIGLKLTQHHFVKWVDPRLIHLTLKFLGNVSMIKLDEVKRELAKAAKAAQPFSLRTIDIGCFPNLKKLRVLWLGVESDSGDLLKLHRDLDEALTRLGFPGEDRAFASHLTLARLKDYCSAEDRLAFSEVIKRSEFKPQFTMRVDSISLMRSQLTPGGPVYTRLAGYRLEGN